MPYPREWSKLMSGAADRRLPDGRCERPARRTHFFFVAPVFVQDVMVADAKPPLAKKKPAHATIQSRAEMGAAKDKTASRSMAATIGVRSGCEENEATRFGSLAALSSIRTEKLTPDLVPVQHRVAGIAEPVDGDGEIVEIIEVVFDCQADDVRSTAPELLRCRIQCIDHRIR